MIQSMNRAQANSPDARLIGVLSSTATELEVDDILRLDDPPEGTYLVIGKGEYAETVRVVSSSGNIVTVERGTNAREWKADTQVARNFTAQDYNRLVDNIETLEAEKQPKEPGKTLSTNDYTNADKAKVASLPENVLGYEVVEEAPLPPLPLDADRLGGHEAGYFAAAADVVGKAPLASPAFTGAPTVNGMAAATTETVKITELLNGWTAWGGVYYPRVARSGNMVSVTAVLQSGTVDAGTTLFVLPEGYRPAVSLPFACQTSKGPKSIVAAASGQVIVDISGLGAWEAGLYYFIDFVMPIKEG